MKPLKITLPAISILILCIFQPALRTAGQSGRQDYPDTSTLREQLKYIENRTRIYENFRAVREDMFQKLSKNVNDSVSAFEAKIGTLRVTISDQSLLIDSLKSYLASTEAGLNEMTRTKNRIRIFGIEVNKITYNTIITIIIAGLAVLLGMGFLAFKRNLIVTSETKKELQDLKGEFEAYRKSAREAREKMSMDHFNEIRKLKGG